MENLLLLAEDEDELYLLSLLINERKYFPLNKRTEPFDLDSYTDEYCHVHFRFFKSDIKRLCGALEIPSPFKLSNGVAMTGLEALCILLRRLCFPNRYADLMEHFPRTICELSRTFNEIIQFLKLRHGHILTDLEGLIFSQERLELYSDSVVSKGSLYPNCCGFIDGTVRPICRPRKNQKEYYNGHKRTHAIKFQSVMMPDGIIGHLFGPVPGRRHDAYLLAASGILDKMQQKFRRNQEFYHLYGDPAYPLNVTLIGPFRGAALTPQMEELNATMSSLRECVEWGFEKILTNFAFLGHKYNLKIGLQTVADYYTVGILLTNCHTCLYSSKTSKYFDCNPPSLEEYLGRNN